MNIAGSSGELERQSFLDHIEQTKMVSHQSSHAGPAGHHVVKMIGCVTTRDPYCLVSGRHFQHVTVINYRIPLNFRRT